MRVTSASFVQSAMNPAQFPKDGRPEIAFVGRSNVGKSSLLNTLLGKKNLAKTSGTPGKTQTINFFEVNNRFYCVDLPGYGFAKVPLKVKEEWGRAMTAYLRERDPLRLVVALLDSRHEPSELDEEMLALLEEAEKPTLLVATKVDKLKRAERVRNLSRMKSALGLEEDSLVLPFSAESGEGRDELWREIEDVVGEEIHHR